MLLAADVSFAVAGSPVQATAANAPVLAQFLVDAAHRYDRSVNPSDAGSPAVFLYTDYFAGGAYTNITASAGLVPNGLDGNDPDAARGTSSFRMTTSAPNGYFELGLAKTTNSPRVFPDYGAVHTLRFWARGDASGESLRINLLQKTGSSFSTLVVDTKALTTGWLEYAVNLPADPVLAPADIYAVQFQLPAPGTVRLDDVRLDTDGTDPLQLIQSYVPGGWAATGSDPNSAAGRDLTIYPNRSFLYDVALASKSLFASGDAALSALALNQVNAVLATAADGSHGYFDVHNSGYVLLADGSARAPIGLRRFVGDNAWFGLSLLDAYRQNGSELYLTRAREISGWFDAELKAPGALQGYLGGYDDSGSAVTWRGTEFNTDAFEMNSQIAAILKARGEVAAAQVYSERAARSAAFVVSMFDAASGKFWTGTTTGDTINESSVPLDAQLFLLLTLKLSSDYANAVDWPRALQYAEAHLVQADGSLSGFTFSTNATANRVWAEGVAQGVATYHVFGDTSKAAAGLQTLESLAVPGGGVAAVSSGTMADPALDAVYDARQAVAPSSWSYLVHLGKNPFASSVPVAPLTAPLVFVIGQDGQVYSQKFDASGQSSSEYVLTQPGAVQALAVGRDASQRTELFVIGGDNQVYAQKFDAAGNSASGYFLAGAGAVQKIGVGHDGNGNPELFVIGGDNQVYAHTFDGNGNAVGEYFLTAPGAVKSLAVGRDASNNPELFVIGGDDQIYALKFNAAGSQSGGYFLASAGRVRTIVAGHDAANDPELFAIGFDGQVYALNFDAAGNAAGGYFLVGAGAIEALQVGYDAANHPVLFVIGGDHQVYSMKFDASGSPTSGYFLTRPGAVKLLSASRYGSGNPELFVVGFDDQLYAQPIDATGSSLGYRATKGGRIMALGTSFV